MSRVQQGKVLKSLMQSEHFAIHAAELFYHWEGNFHGLNFNRATECAPREGHGSHFENDCQREVRFRNDLIKITYN